MAKKASVVSAVVVGLRHQPRSFIRDVGRYPMVRAAEQLLSKLPTVELAQLLSPGAFSVNIAPASSRHAWSLGAAEQVIIDLLIQDRGVRDVFEIGTFNGGTTALIAERVPEGGTVTTLDLPPEQFDASQSPAAFTADQIGEMHRRSAAAGRVTQLHADSLFFDATGWADSADLVLVDGGHDYSHGFADSRSALEIVRPCGLVLWDDFQPYWHGLVRGVVEAMEGRKLARLAGSAFGVYEAPP